MNLNLNNLISITTDGASSFTGKNKGMIALLKQEYPQLMQISWSNHKLQTALKAAIEDKKSIMMKKAIGIVENIYHYYHGSPKRL